ncbi:hypothetical protein [Janibacter limosus]|uniref:hypothetical protein n=1 Tax=Janibacter limosus TaxID=53458 RepID=UPI000831F965|nr:hypothetical protein [Janibacter limosus]
MSESTDRAEGLRAWAEGMYTLTAAAELLIRCGDPLLSGPWVEHDVQRGRYWFNTKTVAEESGYLSGGERRVLDIAAALAVDDRPVALGEAVSGLDRKHLELVLAAIAHAAGSHEHSEALTTENEDGVRQLVRTERLGSLYPWPEGQ